MNASAEQPSEAHSTHWFSHSKYEGPGHSASGTGCMISVVLDASARYDFRGIRILIVYEESEQLKNVSIADCTLPQIHGIRQSGTPTSYRNILSQRSENIRNGRHLLENDDNSALPLCTVALELVAGTTMIPGSLMAPRVTVTLVLWPVISGKRSLRLAYDRVHACTPDSSSFHVVLTSSLSFRDFEGHGNASRGRHRQVTVGILAHSIRVSRISDRRRSPPLPPPILRAIVESALRDKAPGWRTTLLSFGLVCKSWSYVLDLFFGGVFLNDRGDNADVRKVAASLEQNPERAKLLRRLSPRFFRQPGLQDEEEDLQMAKSLADILKIAPLIEYLQLGPIHESLAQDFFDGLSRLRKVHTFGYSGNGMFPGRFQDTTYDPGASLSMDDFQLAIANWPEVATIAIGNWSPKEESSEPTLHGLAKLEDLYLQKGNISGPQLLRFVSTSPSPLRSLDLQNLQGFSNHHLLHFLTATADTLTTLTIHKSHIPRLTEDEEYALDAIMPKMRCLREVTVDAGIASALAIARKSREETYREGSSQNSISIEFSSDVSLESMGNAMEVTGWDFISATWSNVPNWDDDLRQKISAAAQARSIEFHCFNFHLWK